MSEIRLPSAVSEIINRLNAHGHRADIVGGCTRDFLLGKIPSDYDITTDATPDELHEIFKDYKTADTGIRHGTLTVIIDGEPYEVTTYRLDGEYNDHRHPDSVSFTEILSEDLSRRDFTMNAICYNERDGFTDLFSGKEDVEQGIIRTVGDPERRFEEDALRILRGIRFAATLNFRIEEGTARAIKAKADLLLAVSSERVATEWKKLLSGVAALRVVSEYRDVISVVIPELENLCIPNDGAFYSQGASLRELMLFYLAHGEGAAGAYESAARRLKYDNKSRKFGVSVLESLPFCDTRTDVGLKTLLMRVGYDCAEGALRLATMLSLCEESALVRLQELSEESVWQLSELAVNGKDLSSLGIKGEEVGRILKALLAMVVREECGNKKQELISIAKRLKGDKDGV